MLPGGQLGNDPSIRGVNLVLGEDDTAKDFSVTGQDRGGGLVARCFNR
jgi:hypothetical protein